MKKVGLLIVLLGSMLSLNAQPPVQEVLSFFDTNGTVRMETEELNKAADTLVTVFHRKDDIVWARMTYRIIDLRYKQNYQLYFPLEFNDPVYKSLFRVIIDAVTDADKPLPIYRPDRKNFKPAFNDSTRVLPENMNSENFFAAVDADGVMASIDELSDGGYLVYYDSIQEKLVANFDRYPNYTRNQFKYVIQEVIFFDKHTSRLHRQLIAIAPMQLDGVSESLPPMEFLKNSIKFWILYKDLRPYLAKNYMIPLLNETKRVTFDDFFQKRLYTSYLIGETNIYNRMILDYAKTEKEAKKEQARIENELLTFEQDLWEY